MRHLSGRAIEQRQLQIGKVLRNLADDLADNGIRQSLVQSHRQLGILAKAQGMGALVQRLGLIHQFLRLKQQDFARIGQARTAAGAVE